MKTPDYKLPSWVLPFFSASLIASAFYTFAVYDSETDALEAFATNLGFSILGTSILAIGWFLYAYVREGRRDFPSEEIYMLGLLMLTAMGILAALA